MSTWYWAARPISCGARSAMWGRSDGWQDLMGNFKMDWSFAQAGEGNIALDGEIDLSRGAQFVVAVAFRPQRPERLDPAAAGPGHSFREATRQVCRPMAAHAPSDELGAGSRDGGHLMRLSRCILLAHEDKTFPGAFVASHEHPLGRDEGRQRPGRLPPGVDARHGADRHGAARLRTDRIAAARPHLARLRPGRPTAGMPQNSSIKGKPYWRGIQLDEVAVPILLAWRLRREDALRQFDPWTLISRAPRT